MKVKPPLCTVPSSYEDIDECKAGVAGCVANSDCIDTAGGYSCLCRPGFTGNGKTICTGMPSLLQFTLLGTQRV